MWITVSPIIVEYPLSPIQTLHQDQSQAPIGTASSDSHKYVADDPLRASALPLLDLIKEYDTVWSNQGQNLLEHQKLEIPSIS